MRKLGGDKETTTTTRRPTSGRGEGMKPVNNCSEAPLYSYWTCTIRLCEVGPDVSMHTSFKTEWSKIATRGCRTNKTLDGNTRPARRTTLGHWWPTAYRRMRNAIVSLRVWSSTSGFPTLLRVACDRGLNFRSQPHTINNSSSTGGSKNSETTTSSRSRLPHARHAT